MEPDSWMALVPFMPMLAALPLAAAAVLVALIWRRRRDRPVEMLGAKRRDAE